MVAARSAPELHLPEPLEHAENRLNAEGHSEPELDQVDGRREPIRDDPDFADVYGRM